METFFYLAAIVIIIIAVLQVILFFKLWGMTNDIKFIRRFYEYEKLKNDID